MCICTEFNSTKVTNKYIPESESENIQIFGARVPKKVFGTCPYTYLWVPLQENRTHINLSRRP